MCNENNHQCNGVCSECKETIDCATDTDMDEEQTEGATRWGIFLEDTDTDAEGFEIPGSGGIRVGFDGSAIAADTDADTIADGLTDLSIAVESAALLIAKALGDVAAAIREKR